MPVYPGAFPRQSGRPEPTCSPPHTPACPNGSSASTPNHPPCPPQCGSTSPRTPTRRLIQQIPEQPALKILTGSALQGDTGGPNRPPSLVQHRSQQARHLPPAHLPRSCSQIRLPTLVHPRLTNLCSLSGPPSDQPDGRTWDLPVLVYGVSRACPGSPTARGPP